MLFNSTCSPSKQTDSLLEAPPNALQKSVFDSHNSVSLVALALLPGVPPAWPCNEGENGEFIMDTVWHVSHTSEQKSCTATFDREEFAGMVELQSTGTDLGVD